MTLHKLKFGLAYHGDLVLDIDDKWHNLGYNYLSKLPIMLFLNHKQNNFGNLFSKINMPEMNSEYIEDYESKEIILRLDKNNSESLAEKYFRFIKDTIKLEKFRGHLSRIISRLE